MKIKKTGQIVIISSPSGGGKTTICNRLLTDERKNGGWRFSISYTTRGMRPGEQNGREYHFVSGNEFDRLVFEDFFAEHFRVHIARYGTPRGPLEEVRDHGGVMVLDVDIQGARALRKEYPQATTIFVLPPSKGDLKQRLTRRGTETEEQLELRYQNATREMESFREYGFDYVVINDDIDSAVEDVLAIIRSAPCRVDQIPPELLESITG